jgi:hypothetical protein
MHYLWNKFWKMPVRQNYFPAGQAVQEFDSSHSKLQVLIKLVSCCTMPKSENSDMRILNAFGKKPLEIQAENAILRPLSFL